MIAENEKRKTPTYLKNDRQVALRKSYENEH
jgi:hypothetical protein